MDFSYDSEQTALRDAVKGLVGKAYADYEHRRQTAKDDPGFDEKVWTQMAEMGLLGLPFSEDDGGVGAGPIEIGIVCRELGRVLAPEPFLSSVVYAGGLVSAVGTPEQRQEILGALSSGESVLAFAHDEPGHRWTASAVDVTADAQGALTGVKDGVLHGARADVMVVSAALPDGGTGLFVVTDGGGEREGYSTYDGGRAARITFDATPATPLGEAGVDVTSSIATIQDITRIMAANQALGAMQFQLKATVDYLKSRKQFGVTLNNFQALNFRAADMYTSQELTHSLVDWATMVVDGGSPEAVSDAAARVGLQVSRAGRHIGQEAIQLHGGIAMTAEYNVGTYTSHLTVLDHLLGDAGHHIRALDDKLTSYAAIDPLDVAAKA
ncbi:acyl-CoA dehydrogenase family protein [Nocardioides sp.]|uniref:acyl-CoA dehydrogenase family protein n=1 Tax=Nocardioides sp. TaxID=35761 RepID=UPI00271CC63F|nr:acyl-CoA dehydrogenase family protein [Nocardioides sp.]MDO9455535.1 acyl-CoA dehydrogenase family protein [Nocardioides sp.]